MAINYWIKSILYTLVFNFISIDSFPQGKLMERKRCYSEFSERLTPMNRIVEMPGWYVWGCSPIEGDDGKIHVFFSRWKASAGWNAWSSKCEIGHAVADQPEGPYVFVDTAVEPSGPGKWDAFTCHNPTIHKVGDKYALFYIGTTDGTIETQSIGVAVSNSLYGPWQKSLNCLIEKSTGDAWDNFTVSNPAYLAHPSGLSWLYYKATDIESWQEVNGNRKYGLAISENVKGPYKKIKKNPLIDFSSIGKDINLEDAYVFIENGKFKMICRDMGYFDNEVGLYLESEDGINWSKPQIAYRSADYYGIEGEENADHLFRENRFERPQVLMQNGKATYLFGALQGGKNQLSSGFVFKINDK